MRRVCVSETGLFILAIACCVFIPCQHALAVVSGQCSNCHTMHNSQGGAPMTFDNSGTPNSVLAKGDCNGCHTQGGTSHVVTLGQSRIPQVYHTSATDLAGGNFAYVSGVKGSGAADPKGHNVVSAVSAVGGDDVLSAPPGDEFTTGISSGPGGNFTCAGKYGCHGNRAVENGLSSVKGAHHGSDATLDGSTVAKSYRFLLGVSGVENKDSTYGWQNYSATYSNKYKGSNGPAGDATVTSPGTGGTISGFCSECHGKFHGSGANGHGVSGAWIRHPTDILLPNSGAYAAYDPTSSFDATVPVAFTDPSNPTRNTAVVMCLSCHGAHGTNYSDILRWEYANMNAGNGGAYAGTGCFKCHSDKD